MCWQFSIGAYHESQSITTYIDIMYLHVRVLLPQDCVTQYKCTGLLAGG